MITTIAEAEAALQPYVPLVAQLTGKDTTLERIEPLMELLGNPQDQLKIIHIAGTSGKTSTAYYMAALLLAAGKKIGLTVSPHVDSITERVQINGLPLDEVTFCRELDEFLKLVEQAPQKPSYFELLYAFALWEFQRQGVDYAVIETGMGGLHDATNVATRADKVCIITDIGFDHMHVLGHTIPEITAQKIGIVHSGNVALMYQQSDESMAVINEWIAKQQATLQVTNQEAEQGRAEVHLGDLPLYQQRNWLLANYAYDYVANRDNLEHLTRQVLQKTLEVQVPGRMDVRQIQDKTIIMDGAHNEQKMTAFLQSFQQQYPDSRPVVLLALKQGKEYRAVAPLLAPIASQIIVTTFATSQDLPALAMDPEVLADELRTAGAQEVQVIPDHAEAYQNFLQTTQNIGIITGSFYLLSQIRKLGA